MSAFPGAFFCVGFHGNDDKLPVWVRRFRYTVCLRLIESAEGGAS